VTVPQGSRTNVYVDGFNLYYGIRETPYKWLDLPRLCQLILPSNQIQRIRYFTAQVNARATDPDGPVRQQTYLRALETLPCVSVHLGHFLTHEVRMALVKPQPGRKTALVLRTEEKGSDVNLATMLLVDAFRADFETAVIISNDSDLALPVQIVTKELGLPVGVINPHSRPSFQLKFAASFWRRLRPGPLRASQFPQTMSDANGSFSKPAAW
jgi:uncharacterized LabA/DUF88 family protein